MVINRRALFFIFLFCNLLSACTDFTTTQSIHPTSQNIIQTKTYTNTPTKTPAVSFTSPISSSTEQIIRPPSVTPRPSIKPTTSLDATRAEPPEVVLLETQIAGFFASCNDGSLNRTSLSPTGNWLVINCEKNNIQNLRIYNRTGKKWELLYKDYVDKEDLIYAGGLYPVRWTNDEKYLYFRSSIRMSAGGTCFYGGFGQGLYRLDLANGSVASTLTPLKNAGLYNFSFSPSGRWLAVNTYILDLQTGEQISLEGREYSFGDFNWSPDSSKLAYSSCLPSKDQFFVNQSAIRIFSLVTRKSKTIFTTGSKDVLLRIDSKDGSLFKIFSDEYNNRIEYASFDWSTEKLTTTTPTPTP